MKSIESPSIFNLDTIADKIASWFEWKKDCCFPRQSWTEKRREVEQTLINGLRCIIDSKGSQFNVFYRKVLELELHINPFPLSNVCLPFVQSVESSAKLEKEKKSKSGRNLATISRAESAEFLSCSRDEAGGRFDLLHERRNKISNYLRYVKGKYTKSIFSLVPLRDSTQLWGFAFYNSTKKAHDNRKHFNSAN